MADRHHGRTVFIHADARDPGRLLADPALRDLIDFEAPVAILLVGLLHFMMDHEQPDTLVKTLLGAVRPAATSRSATAPPTSRRTSARRRRPPTSPRRCHAGCAAGARSWRCSTASNSWTRAWCCSRVAPGRAAVPEDHQQITYAAVGRKL